MKNSTMTSCKTAGSFRGSGWCPAFWLVLCITFFWTATSVGQTTTVFNIPPNDTQAFLDAIHEANQSRMPSIIRLAENSEYAFDLLNKPPEDISVTLTIEGHNSHLVGAGNEQGSGQLFTIKGGASLELSNLVIRGFHSSHASADGGQNGLIHVRGVLLVKDVQIDQISSSSQIGLDGAVFTNESRMKLKNVRISNVTNTRRAVVMWNGATADLENVLIIDSSHISPTGETLTGYYIWNHFTGELDIRFSTFIASSDLIAPEQSQHLIFHDNGGFSLRSKSMVKASILIDVGCTGESAGFNLVNDPTCEQRNATDKVGVSAEPLLIESQDGYVVIPQLGSPALDGVVDINVDFECPDSDVLGTLRPQDGNGNGEARCDIGAFEKKESANLFAGGENGLFYEASQDGHYVTLQEVRPNEYFMHWLTFDRNGNQAWIFAMGSSDGDTITARAYFNPVGILIPGGGAEVDMAAQQDWGTITIELFTCLTGEFSYETDLPQFGSGSFMLNRLAFIEQLGCKSD